MLTIDAQVGFVGNLQLWLPASSPTTAILSTGISSLLWDLRFVHDVTEKFFHKMYVSLPLFLTFVVGSSKIDLDTGELTNLERNPMSTNAGRAYLLFALVSHLFFRCLAFVLACVTMGTVTLSPATIDYLAPPPCAPVQYFVDSSGCVIGCAQACVTVELAFRFSVKTGIGSWMAACPDTPFARLNMQMMGSSGASGTLRMDPCAPDSPVSLDQKHRPVLIHTCNTADTTAYVRYPGAVCVANDSRADIDGFISSASDSNIVEAIVVSAARSQLVATNAAGARLIEELACVRRVCGSHMSGEDVELMLVSRTRADNLWMLRATSDTTGARFFLHTPYQASLPRLLLASRPKLEGLPLCATEPVTILARDGERIPGYLTRPPAGRGGGVRVPLAIVLHGGPNARDYAGYNPTTHLLSTRGMAVLTLNYRGSTGYGMRFAALPNGRLPAMHGDVEDARRWAIDCGLADPLRIVLVGGSWGGYLALGAATGLGVEVVNVSDASLHTAAVETIEQPKYAAVVAIVPLVAVGAANKSKAFRGDPLVRQYWQHVYGAEVSSNEAAAQKLSPLFRLDKLKSKVLLIHGERDIRVPREHGDAVAARAKEMQLFGAHLTYADEGHSIRRERNVLHMWHAVERFLCSSLDLELPPSLDPVKTHGHSCTVQWDNTHGLLSGLYV